LQQASTQRWAYVGDQALAWRLRRNCSVTPRQLAGLYAALCLLSLWIAVGFWMLGMPLVLAFAGLELLAVGAALLVHARHALDGETVRLQGGRLIVERECAGRCERLEFGAAQVRIAPPASERGLIELSAAGRRIAIGRHVRPSQRPALASDLRKALWAGGLQ